MLKYVKSFHFKNVQINPRLNKALVLLSITWTERNYKIYKKKQFHQLTVKSLNQIFFGLELIFGVQFQHWITLELHLKVNPEIFN